MIRSAAHVRPRSIAARLVMLLTIGMTVLWLAGALISSAILQHELNESFDRAEAEIAHRLLPLMTDALFDRDEAGHDVHEIHHFPVEAGRALIYQVRAPDGRLLIKSDDAPDALLDAGATAGFSTTAQFRVFTVVDARSGLSIQVAEPLSNRARAVWGSTLTLFLPLLVLIPLSALGIWFGTRRGLEPLSRLRQQIASRDSANLSPIASEGLPAELTPISAALSGLILRLRAALEAERQFAANSAHELRTPIAAALAQTQRLLETTTDQRALAEGRKIEATLRRLASLAEKLLQLARAEAGMAATGEPAAVLPILRLVIDDVAARSGRLIELEVEPAGEDLRAPINVDALGIVLRNLIDNAVNHSPPDTPVKINVSRTAITIRNEGPAVEPEMLGHLRDRFVRGATVVSGSGLGLAIVDAILAQTGGSLTLASPPSGHVQGFEAVLAFSRAEPESEEDGVGIGNRPVMPDAGMHVIHQPPQAASQIDEPPLHRQNR
jgi:two-component system OmpR family sensor kinase